MFYVFCMTVDVVVFVYSSSVMDCKYVIFDEMLRLTFALLLVFTLVLGDVSF